MLRRACVLGCVLLVPGCGAAVAPAPDPIPPPADRDEDRIADAADACPGDPEDEDGSDDADGCPDPDNDHDAVLDVADLCPSDPEDMDGFQDADGCPDPDNDQDRIVDTADQCPCIPEVYNGYEDEDGCPDRGRIILIDERLMILDKVHFARRSSSIDPGSVRVLEAVAATLVHNPQLTLVEVAGHATRDEPGAQALSEARAAAVRDALVAAGVDAARLVTRGHGSAQPIAEGRSREANERNRRVEFVILEPAQGPASDQQQPPLPGPVPGCPEVGPGGVMGLVGGRRTRAGSTSAGVSSGCRAGRALAKGSVWETPRFRRPRETELGAPSGTGSGNAPWKARRDWR